MSKTLRGMANSRTGKIRVFDTVDKVWLQRWPIDVSEGLASGQYSLTDGADTVTANGAAAADAELIETIRKASIDELEVLIGENDIDVDLTGLKTLAKKRKAVEQAVG